MKNPDTQKDGRRKHRRMGTAGRGIDKVGYSITDMFLFQEKKNVMKQCILKISRKVNFIDM